MTTVVVTHDMNSVMGIGERVMYLHQGKKLWEGDNKSILTAKVPELMDFIFASKVMQGMRNYMELKGELAE